jgi:predicted branched-subunit amino acid permease
MVKAGMTPWQAVGMSLLVYAGSAQLAALPLMVSGASLPIIWISALIVNLRFFIYSLGLRPWFRQQRPLIRALYGTVSTDAQVVAIAQRFSKSSRSAGRRRLFLRYFQVSAAMNWACWQVCSFVGIFLGAQLPEESGLAFLASLALLTLLLPMLKGRPAWGCVATAAAVSVALKPLPLNLGLLVSVVAGVAVALWLTPSHHPDLSDQPDQSRSKADPL